MTSTGGRSASCFSVVTEATSTWHLGDPTTQQGLCEQGWGEPPAEPHTQPWGRHLLSWGRLARAAWAHQAYSSGHPSSAPSTEGLVDISWGPITLHAASTLRFAHVP